MKVLSGGLDNSATAETYLFEFKNYAQGFAWLRAVVYSSIFFVFLLLQLLQSDFLSPSFWQPVNILMAIAFTWQFVYVFLFDKAIWLRQAFIATLVLDVVLLSLFMGLWAVPHSIFLFFVLALCITSSLTLGLHSGIKYALWASFVFHLTIALSPDFMPESMKTAWVVNNASIFAVSFLGGYLGDQLKTVAVDIELKKEEIQALTDVNELIVDNIPSGLILFSSDLKILKANRGAAKIFNDLALETKTLTEVSPHLNEAILSRSFDLNESASRRFEVDHYNYKKEKMVLDVVLAKIKKTQATAGDWVCLVDNKTEIKILEENMRQKEKLAAVGQLAAGIAHEIRNPLASISGSVQLLQGNLQTQTPEDKKLLAIVVREIDRLNKLISEFLDFVRPDVRLEDPVQISQLVREVLDAIKFNQNLPQKVEQSVDLQAKQSISGHHDKLKQAFFNIVINAYQAMSETLRPLLIVQTYDAEGQVILKIKDNGLGMTADNLKRIFEPFHTTKPSGTGLGLAITHKILESHSAQVIVESRLGHGTEFVLIFPSRGGSNETSYSHS